MRDLIPMACSEFMSASLLQVLPASRGQLIPIARSEFMNCPPPLGSPRFARGTALGIWFPLRAGLTESAPAWFPLRAGLTESAPVWFPLRAGGTLRRGSSTSRVLVNFSLALGLALVLHTLLPAQQPAAPTVRLKDIAQIRGVRTNQLVGYGIVVGLEGTGDSNGALFTVQSVANMLERFGITVPPNALKVKNVAAVMVTAELPPFARAGNTIDVVVSSIGDARSLQGGTLLQTPLRGADGQVYAVAQGPLSIGGFNFGGGGARVQRNHTTVGRIPNGALIEREVPASFLQGDNSLTIQLHKPDFTTAARVVSSIRSAFPNLTVRAVDPSTVRIALDAQHATDPVMLIAQLETLTVLPDIAARVVVNERTGTVVVNGDVRVAPVAIAHGGITVRVQTTFEVSQPPPLSEGQTKVVPQTQVDANEEPARMVYFREGASVESLVKALNALGVSPRDLIAILQALKAAGALHAEIEVQ
jgi:flagellar P-ring protein precursor FlgI